MITMMNAPTSSSSNNNNDQHRRTTFNNSDSGQLKLKSNDSELIRRSFLLHLVDIQRQRRTPSPPTAPKSTSTSQDDRPPDHPAPRLSRRRQSMHNRRGSVETTLGNGDGRQLPTLPFPTKAELNTTHNNRHPAQSPPPNRSRDGGDRPTPNNSSSSHQKGAPTTTHPPSSTSFNNKLERRSSHTGITAGFAQEMIAEIVSSTNTTNKAKSNKTSHHGPPRRRVTVSHAASNLQLQQLQQSQAAAQYENNLYPSSSSPLRDSRPMQEHEEDQESTHNGFRSDYKLGECSRHPSHMIIPQTTAGIDTLGRYDFAFVKRSNGTYSYAILAYRTNIDQSDIHVAKGECMAFVIDDIGSTKMIRKKYWREYIRLVASEQNQDHHLLPVSQDHSEKKKNDVVLCREIPVACQEIPYNHHHAQEVNHDQDDQEKDECDELLIPDMIVFRPQENHDECSLISSISDKARMKWRR